jgi:hypothetical protein
MVPGTSDVKYNNPSWGVPSGTIQYAKLAFSNGSPDYGTGNWEPGIGNMQTPYIVSDTYSMGWTDEANAVPTFWRAIDSSDAELLMLINQLPERSGDHFDNLDDAKTWLESTNKYVLFPRPVILMLSLDAASYSGTGTWNDSVGGKQFTLYNSPTKSTNNGGYITFNASSSQYGECTSSLSDLSTWSVEAWHYYTGSNIGSGACILTEIYPGQTGRINYSLGDTDNGGPLGSSFFDGGWQKSGTYNLTPNNWYHIVGTYDGSNVNIYVNNTLVSTQYYVGTPSSSQGGIRLMRRWDNPSYWDGRLAVANIYSGAMDFSTVSYKWNARKSRFGL